MCVGAADAVAVSHYCHWFQPLTGGTAEKHDAFLNYQSPGNFSPSFSGKELLQSEPDGSSFPSGGLRSTHSARAYAAWDQASPPFVLTSAGITTLYIPSVFISYNGEATDHKLPLLRSQQALSEAGVALLHLLGNRSVTSVFSNVGAEQEFFLLPKELVASRPDLALTGRTLLGVLPPKGQEMEDAYFGHMPGKVQAFISELENQCYLVGIPLKTRHNEVAPGQFEVAPIFEESNIAVDHNMLLMKIAKVIAEDNDLVAIFHEKPFAGVNGSGKHVNWSVQDSTGRNLLDPSGASTSNQEQNSGPFLTFLAGALLAIHSHGDVLRASIASAGNDHRLGANEAPPAIMSAYLGEALAAFVSAVEHGEQAVFPSKTKLSTGVKNLDLVKDVCDRNRTSPFAFTGNKFEFRAVGSSANISLPVATLNAAMADSLKIITSLIEQEIAKQKKSTASFSDVLAVVRKIIVLTKNSCFEGNGYSAEWQKMAAARGLGNHATTPQALLAIHESQKTAFLTTTGVLSAAEISARHDIFMERYIKQRVIEAKTFVFMAKNTLFPATVKAGLATEANEIGSLTQRVDSLISKVEHQMHESVNEAGILVAGALMTALETARAQADAIESQMDSALYPFPNYLQLLFPAKLS